MEDKALVQVREAIHGLKLTKDEVKAVVAGLPLEQLAQIWVKKSMVNQLFEAVDERLQALDDATLNSLGLERQPGRNVRTVRDLFELFTRLQSHYPISSTDFLVLCSIQISALENFIVNRGKTKAEAKRLADSLLEGICDVTQTKPSIKTKPTEGSGAAAGGFPIA